MNLGRKEVELTEIVPVGRMPPLGVIPQRMHAWAIRPDRHGVPTGSFRREELPPWNLGERDVLIQVMAAGVNYNGIWAGLGTPVSPFAVHKHDYHIPGSDASGVVWAVGAGVTRWKVGDEVVVHCNRTCGMCESCNGGEPMACQDQGIWGYESPDGSFAQYTRVQAQQVLPKPPQLTWEEAASYGLTYYTAFRMLIDRAKVQPGEVVLVWGAAGGLGVFAVQLCRLIGARAIAVVSSQERAALVKELGAVGVIDRSEFPGLQYRGDETAAQAKTRAEVTKAFGKRIWELLGERKAPDVVFEHVGRSTFPASVFLAERFGRIVICGATTGYDLHFDVRHLWMRQKSILGSHFADAGEAHRANRLILQGQIRPVLTRTFTWDEIAHAHQLMLENQLYGTVACLVGAPTPGLKNLDETLASVAGRA